MLTASCYVFTYFCTFVKQMQLRILRKVLRKIHGMPVGSQPSPGLTSAASFSNSENPALHSKTTGTFGCKHLPIRML